MQFAIWQVGDGGQGGYVAPDCGGEEAEVSGCAPVADDAGAGEVEEVAWNGFLEEAGEKGVQGGLVVGVAAVHDYIGLRGVVGEQGGGVVVAWDNGDVGVQGSEVRGDATEENGDGVFRVRGGDSVEDGAADIACSAGADWELGRWVMNEKMKGGSWGERPELVQEVEV
jgi:hypothetical protein